MYWLKGAWENTDLCPWTEWNLNPQPNACAWRGVNIVILKSRRLLWAEQNEERRIWWDNRLESLGYDDEGDRIILSRLRGVTLRRGLDWMIGFIDTLYTPLGSTGNYSAIADLHTSRYTVTHTLRFSVFTSRILVTDFYTGAITVSLNHSVKISLYYSTPKDLSSLPNFQLST
jgi:hypothetical protein